MSTRPGGAGEEGPTFNGVFTNRNGQIVLVLPLTSVRPNTSCRHFTLKAHKSDDSETKGHFLHVSCCSGLQLIPAALHMFVLVSIMVVI